MENIGKNPVVYWNRKVPDTELERFQRIIEQKYSVKFSSYWEFHQWTVKKYTHFWEEMWYFFDIISSQPFDKVLLKTGPGFLDNEWFSGGKLNYAENVLRIRDDRIALICLDEFGEGETVTFAELFQQVQLYAAAFRRYGLKIGDRVACFMSNRKEAIFAMLAVASIGAIWGGPVPYYGARAASNIVKMMDPKFLIAVDSHQDNGIIYPTLDYLPEIVDNTSTLEKVILLATQEETREKDLSSIRNCVLLEDFLQEGHSGNIPELAFQQLSFNQPLSINFTSGTTGLPKAVIHSAGTMISIMRDYSLSYDMKTGDVVCLNYPVGWSLWENYIPCLALGIKIFLYAGSIYHTINGMNFWDLLSKYDAKMVILITSMVDKMEKMNMIPSSDSNMSCLKEIIIAGSPVKKNNFEYLQTKVKKDVFVGILYGATEVFGTFSGLNMNLPVYGGEVQVPSLGIDMQCFDSRGNSVIGEKGELVICTPAINFPTGLWKDVNNRKLTDTYLKKFPGVWTQHDECWINPETNGIIVIGRSDDTIKQKGERFGAADVYFAKTFVEQGNLQVVDIRVAKIANIVDDCQRVYTINSVEELEDYICVSQQNRSGDCRAVLFVKMRKCFTLTNEIRMKIERKVEEELYTECVPELIVEVPDIPYNLNNKRMESLVRKIIENNSIPEVMNIRNPNSLKHFVNILEIVNYDHQ